MYRRRSRSRIEDCIIRCCFSAPGFLLAKVTGAGRPDGVQVLLSVGFCCLTFILTVCFGSCLRCLLWSGKEERGWLGAQLLHGGGCYANYGGSHISVKASFLPLHTQTAKGQQRSVLSLGDKTRCHSSQNTFHYGSFCCRKWRGKQISSAAL